MKFIFNYAPKTKFRVTLLAVRTLLNSRFVHKFNLIKNVWFEVNFVISINLI